MDFIERTNVAGSWEVASLRLDGQNGEVRGQQLAAEKTEKY